MGLIGDVVTGLIEGIRVTGFDVGCRDGFTVGDSDGSKVEGWILGSTVGSADGSKVGSRLGNIDGTYVVGFLVGNLEIVGMCEIDGLYVGFCEGRRVG